MGSTLNPLNPLKQTISAVRGDQSFGESLARTGPIGGKFAEQKASQKQQVKKRREAESRSEQEAKAFEARMQAKRDVAATEASEAARSRRRGLRGSRRSLLTGDERGVDVKGQRKTTG